MRDDIHPPPHHPPAWRDRLLTLFRRRRWRGFVRLYGILKSHTAQRLIRTVSSYGTQFLLNPWDSVDTHVLTEGFYESEVLEAVRPYLRSSTVVWVVGANFGLHAVTLKSLHPDTRVIAFEPSPAMGSRLLANCELNDVRVELHSYALSDRRGLAPFFANASGNPGMSTLHPTPNATYDHTFVVQMSSPAEVIETRAAPAPEVMILDAEGAEFDILRGFGSHLKEGALRAFVFEAPNALLEHSDNLRTLIEDAGFALARLERIENTGHSLSNFIATRRR